MVLLASDHRAESKLKRSFLASLGIHASFLLIILVAASIPKRLHIEPMAFVELAGVKGLGSQGTASGTTPSLKTRVTSAAAVSKSSPAVKTNVAQPATQAQTRGESVSVQSKSAKKSKETTQNLPDLRERILQRLTSMDGGSSSSTATAISQTNMQAAGQTVGGITTSVPFPYASYLLEIQYRITELWEEPAWIAGDSGSAKAVVFFRIHRDGTMEKIVLAVPSGIAALDKSVLQAVQSANPLPPLPVEFQNPYLDVHLQFDLTR